MSNPKEDQKDPNPKKDDDDDQGIRIGGNSPRVPPINAPPA